MQWILWIDLLLMLNAFLWYWGMWVEVMSISILVLNCSPAKFKFCNLSPKVNFLDSRISLRHFYPSNGRFVAKLLINRRQIYTLFQRIIMLSVRLLSRNMMTVDWWISRISAYKLKTKNWKCSSKRFPRIYRSIQYKNFQFARVLETGNEKDRPV